MLKHASTTSEMPANDNSLNFTAYTGYTRTTSDSGIHLAEATESKFRSIYIGSVQVTFIRRRTETNSRDSRAFKTRLSCLLITVACIDLREKQPRNVTVRLTSTEATIEQSKTMRFIDTDASITKRRAIRPCLRPSSVRSLHLYSALSVLQAFSVLQLRQRQEFSVACERILHSFIQCRLGLIDEDYTKTPPLDTDANADYTRRKIILHESIN